MKKLILTWVLTAVLGTGLAYANSVTYQISATIPAIIGVNVPVEEALGREDLEVLAQQSLDRQVTELTRNNERIVLETFVPK